MLCSARIVQYRNSAVLAIAGEYLGGFMGFQNPPSKFEGFAARTHSLAAQIYRKIF